MSHWANANAFGQSASVMETGDAQLLMTMPATGTTRADFRPSAALSTPLRVLPGPKPYAGAEGSALAIVLEYFPACFCCFGFGFRDLAGNARYLRRQPEGGRARYGLPAPRRTVIGRPLLPPPPLEQGGAAAARLAHNQKVAGSSPAPATISIAERAARRRRRPSAKAGMVSARAEARVWPVPQREDRGMRSGPALPPDRRCRP